MKKTKASPLTRRQFITRTAAVSSFMFIPSHLALGKKAKSSPYSLSANERVNLACIGIGNRGKSDIISMTQAGAGKMANIVALCDVDIGATQNFHTHRL